MPYQINWDRAAKRKNKDEIELGPEDPRVLHAADGRVFLFYNSPPIHDFKAPACIR